MASRTAAARRRRQKKRTRMRILVILCLVLVAIATGWLIGIGARLVHDLLHPDQGIYTIAVDAGHGGTDVGANGVIQECDMTAQTAELLYQLLDADPHYRPCRTRDSYDTTAEPSERVAEANRRRADLLISIHGNSAGDETVRGFECYPVTPGRKYHEKSLRFAQLLAGQMADAGASLRGTEGIRYAYYVDGQKVIVDGVEDDTREEDTFTILEEARCPAVLVEQCFVTSPEDVAQYAGESGCALCADRYYRAICAYFGTEPYPAPESAADSGSSAADAP